MDHTGNMIYENCALKRIPMDGTYVENGHYFFYIRYHLGNNRMLAKVNGTLIQTNHYYPYGMTFTQDGSRDPKAQPYKYGGKEFDGERGLNLYDYLARSMDAAEGRFTSIDPLAEKYYSISPYSYCGNNPVKYINPDGRKWTSYTNIKGHTTIKVALFFSISDNYKAAQINAYKNSISTQFNNTILEVSGEKIPVTFTFYGGNQNITQKLALDKMNKSIGGMTSFFNSSVNLYNRARELKSLSDIGSDTTHEIMHTIRLDDPFEVTQTEDTKLLRSVLHSFVSTLTTDPNIVNNIISYSMIMINGQKSTNQNSLTKGQLNFMMNEIKLQNQGYGFK